MACERKIKLLFGLLFLFTLIKVKQAQIPHKDDTYESHIIVDRNNNLLISDENKEAVGDGETTEQQDEFARNNLIFIPNILNFKERSIGDPHNQVVIVINKHKSRSVYLNSISSNTTDYYSSYFNDKIIQTGRNTTFNIVFLPRQLGIKNATLNIHTSFGMIKYQIRGEGVECPYRLKPLVGLKAPLNATITPEILMYNPHDTTIQICEIYSSGGNFQLELINDEFKNKVSEGENDLFGDSGTGGGSGGSHSGQEGPQQLWEIPPFTTKSIIRIRFFARQSGNYTAYVRIKISGVDPKLKEKILIVPIEIEIYNHSGIYSKIPNLDLGVIGTNDAQKQYHINLLNSDPNNNNIINNKDITIRTNAAITTSTTTTTTTIENWSIESLDLPNMNSSFKINYEQLKNRLSIQINWKKIINLNYLSGNILLNTLKRNCRIALSQSNSSTDDDEDDDIDEDDEDDQYNINNIDSGSDNVYKYIYKIPFSGQLINGNIEYNEDTLKFLITPKGSVPTTSATMSSLSSRNFILKNKFHVPLTITNITVPDSLYNNFQLIDFKPVTIQPNTAINLFQIKLKNPNNQKLLSNEPDDTNINVIKLITNVTNYDLNILCYNGLLTKIIPLDDDMNGNIIDNSNANNLNKLLDFGTLPISRSGDLLISFINRNPTGITINSWNSLLINGTGQATISVTYRGCGEINKRDNLNLCHTLKQNEWVIYQVTVSSNIVGKFFGKFSLQTQFENVTIPIQFRTAMGRLELNNNKLRFDDCFPGKICSLKLSAHSTFLQTIHVEEISSDLIGIRYERTTSSAEQKIPDILPNIITGVGNLYFDPKTLCKNLCYTSFDLLSKPFGVKWMATLDDFVQYNALDYDKLLKQKQLFNEIRSQMKKITFRLTTNQIKRLEFNATINFVWPKLVQNQENNIIRFPILQNQKEYVKFITITNPSDQTLFVHFVLHDVNIHGNKLMHNLTDILQLNNKGDCTIECLQNTTNREFKFLFDDNKGDIHVNSIKPRESVKIGIRFQSQEPGNYSTILYMRNNLTVIDAVWLTSRTVLPQFKFGNRKSGSSTPLLFEVSEKRLKVCNNLKEQYIDNSLMITTKRTFTAKNWGEVPITISALKIEDELCEGYGFKVFNCSPFDLEPNSTRKIELGFSPDFTLARLTRTLNLVTSMDYSVNFTLIGTVPPNALEICSKTIKRPEWESTIKNVLIFVLTISLIFVFCGAFLDAGRIIKNHLVMNLTRENIKFEPPLDLRQIALQSSSSKESTINSTSPPRRSVPHAGAKKKLKKIMNESNSNHNQSTHNNHNTNSNNNSSYRIKKTWNDFKNKFNGTPTNNNNNHNTNYNKNQENNANSSQPSNVSAKDISAMKEKPIEEDSSSTTTESSINSDASEKHNTCSSSSSSSVSSSQKQKSSFNNNNNNINHDSMSTYKNNPLQSSYSRSNIKKTKSLPANYEAITSNNAQNTSNTNNNQNNNNNKTLNHNVYHEKSHSATSNNNCKEFNMNATTQKTQNWLNSNNSSTTASTTSVSPSNSFECNPTFIQSCNTSPEQNKGSESSSQSSTKKYNKTPGRERNNYNNSNANISGNITNSNSYPINNTSKKLGKSSAVSKNSSAFQFSSTLPKQNSYNASLNNTLQQQQQQQQIQMQHQQLLHSSMSSQQLPQTASQQQHQQQLLAPYTWKMGTSFSDVVAQSPIELNTKTSNLNHVNYNYNNNNTKLPIRKTISNVDAVPANPRKLISIQDDGNFLTQNIEKEENCSPVDLGPIGTRKSPSSTPVWEPLSSYIQRPIATVPQSQPPKPPSKTIAPTFSLATTQNSMINSNSFFSSTFPQYNNNNSEASSLHSHNQKLPSFPSYLSPSEQLQPEQQQQSQPQPPQQQQQLNKFIGNMILGTQKNPQLWERNSLPWHYSEEDYQMDPWKNTLWTPMGFPQQSQQQQQQQQQKQSPNQQQLIAHQSPSGQYNWGQNAVQSAQTNESTLRPPPGLTLSRLGNNQDQDEIHPVDSQNQQQSTMPAYDLFVSSIWSSESNDPWSAASSSNNQRNQ